MKIVAIIQARMGSTRLPGKVLKPILGKPMLQYMIERVNRARTIDQIVVATTTDKRDDTIVKLAKQLNIAVYRGSEMDALDRYFQAAKQYKANIVVRLTADCPLIDPALIDQAVGTFRPSGNDYVGNRHPVETVPSGFDVEVLTIEALARAWHEAISLSDREHVTAYIYAHPELFKVARLTPLKIRHFPHLSVDTFEDFQRIERIYEELYLKKKHFTLKDVMKLKV